MKTSLREVNRNLRRRPLQSVLAVLGILCGMAGVLLLASMGNGVRASIEQQVQAIGPGMMEVMASLPLHGVPVPLTKQDAHVMENELQGVAWVTPITQTTIPVEGPQGQMAGSILGVNAMFPSIESIKVVQGHFFTPMDDRQMRQVAVIGTTLASQLFTRGHVVGQSLDIGNQVYAVEGVFSLQNGVSVSGPNNLVLIPNQTFAAQWNPNNTINAVLIQTSNPSRVPQLKDKILTILVRRHGWHTPLSDFTISTQTGILSASKSLEGLFGLFVRGAIIVAFVVGGIGIMNVMLMAVSDRRHDIGVWMAFGASRSTIVTQFLLESAIISLLGTTSGAVVGTLLGFLLLTQGYPFVLTFSSYGLVVTLGMSLGIVFGLYPSLRAAWMTPIEAIRG